MDNTKINSNSFDSKSLKSEKHADMQRAIRVLFSQALMLGLVEDKENFEDKLEAINDLMETSFNSGIIDAKDFKEFRDPVALIDEIAKRQSTKFDNKTVILKNNDKYTEEEENFSVVFTQISKEMSKSQDEQDEKVYFEAGRALGNKIDDISCKISDKITENTSKVNKAFKNLWNKRISKP